VKPNAEKLKAETLKSTPRNGHFGMSAFQHVSFQPFS
jgi:hypothetical protein